MLQNNSFKARLSLVILSFFVLSLLMPIQAVDGISFSFNNNADAGAYFNLNEENESYNYGDVSGNGVVSIIDAHLLMKLIIGLVDLPEEQLINADVTGDDSISIADVVLILRYLVGLIDAFPAGEPAEKSDGLNDTEGNVNITTGDYKVSPGEEFWLTLNIKDGKDVFAGAEFQLEIEDAYVVDFLKEYDEYIDMDQIVNKYPDGVWNNYPVDSINAEKSGIIHAALTDSKTIRDNGDFLSIKLVAKGNPGESTKLSFSKTNACGNGKAVGSTWTGGNIKIVSKLSKVSQPVWEGKVLKWNSVDNAKGYRVTLFQDGNEITQKDVSSDVSSIDMTSIISEHGYGQYMATVQAIGDNEIYNDGPISEFSEPFDPRDKAINIPDDNLKNFLKDKLEKETDDITPRDMKDLTQLDVMEKEIVDITGLEYATNLESLNLSYNNISDIEPLSGLGLRFLHLSSNKIEDITPLSSVESLERLYISNNQVNDIKALSALSLEVLELGSNEINDITPLSELTDSLRSLDLSDNEIDDFSKLDWTLFSSLWRLNLSSNNINDIHWLEGVEFNNHIEVWGSLNLSNNNITDIKPLTKVSGLREINLSNNSISRIDDIINLNLMAGIDLSIGLNLSHNKIDDISVFSNFDDMGFFALDLSHNSITDMEPLSSIDMLYSLRLSSNHITRLCELPDVYRLFLDNNNISDLSNIEAKMPSLSELSLSGNQISDLKDILDLTELSTLNLLNNYLDLTPESQTMTIIEELKDNEVKVEYEPQRSIIQTKINHDTGKYDDTIIFEHAETELTITSDTELTGSVYLNRYDKYNIPIPEALKSAGIYLHAGHSGELTGAEIRMEVSYNPDTLPTGSDISELKLYRYNEDNKTWEMLPDQGINTEDKYIWTNVNDFSVFGVFITESEEDKDILHGDVEGDGKITVSDAIKVLRHIVGLISLDEDQQKRAKVSDGEGELAVEDAILILRHIVGLIYEFPAEK